MKSAKIKTLKELLIISKKFKKKGKKIVFVHGFFDILHRGHIELIMRAKKLGDVLIVGVDHDYNAKIIKGPNRPINNHNSRIFVISSIGDVDFVFLIPSFKGKKIKLFYENLYIRLAPDIVATSMKAGKHGHLKKEHAVKAGAKFVDIDHGFYKLSTTKISKLLKIE